MNESYIINLITEETKKEIEEQITYLKNMADGRHHKEEFATMLRGANTVMYVLGKESISQQGTRAFLDHLDRDQLDYAIEEAKKLKKQKTDIGKVKLFGVLGGKHSAGWYWDEGTAKKSYVEAAVESLETPWPEVSFDTREVPAEELEDYLSKADAEEALKLLSK